jgi:cob(I)alamin adenosyltransferase
LHVIHLTFNNSIMKIYTKTGDKGTTGLYGGTRVKKSDDRLDLYGTVDELLSNLGLVHDLLNEPQIKSFIIKLQAELFCIGSYIAASPEKKKLKLPILHKEYVEEMELQMDQWNEEVSPLKYFILPGGHKTSSQIHIARTLCRKVERKCVGFEEGFEEKEHIIIFLNRFSDYLFVLARYFNHVNNVQEIAWIPEK